MASRTPSIRLALILVVSLGTLLPSLTMMAWNIQNSYNTTRVERIEQRISQYIALTKPTILNSTWDVDKANIQQTAAAVMTDQSVTDINIATESDPHWVHLSHATSQNGMLFTRNIPLVMEGLVIGSYSITLSDCLVRQELLASIWQQMIILLLQNLISLGLILWLLDVRLMRPLIRLKTDTEHLSVGGLEEPITALYADEIGSVARGLDKARRDLKSVFAQYAALNANLEHRVSERTQELENTNIELRSTIGQLDQARDELVETDKLSSLGALVAGIAHELNTPIGNALLLSSTLVEESIAFSPKLNGGMTRADLVAHEALIRKAADMIQFSCSRAADLIVSFKQVAVDRTSALRRTGQLHQFVYEVLATLQPTIKQTPHTVIQDIDEYLELDTYPGPLGQVIMNMVNNVLLHAFPEGRVGSLRITGKLEGNYAVLRFIDDGVGIPPDNLPRIFDPFFTTKFGQGGSGLGLYIVRNIIISTLGGKIKVESQVGAGTTFVVSIALFAPEGAEMPEEN